MSRIPYSKRKDGRYYKQIVVGYDENGKRKVKTLYDRDWRALDKKVRKFMLNLDNYIVVQDDITLKECIDLWFETKVDIIDWSKVSYKQALKHVRCIQYMKMKDIRPLHIQKIYTDLYNKQLYGMLKSIHVRLKSIFDFAVRNDFVSTNIMDKVIMPKVKTKKTRRSLTQEEREAVSKAFNIFNDFEKAFVGIALYTGMRRNEILALKLQDIDFNKNCIHVTNTLTRDTKGNMVLKDTTKTFAGIRDIPIVSMLRNILEEYISKNNFNDFYIFKTERNNLISSATFNNRWKKIKEKINMFMPNGQVTDITPHYFRHNFATDLVYANIPIKTVQYILGHKDIQTTMDIYADCKLNINDVVQKMDLFLKEDKDVDE